MGNIRSKISTPDGYGIKEFLSCPAIGVDVKSPCRPVRVDGPRILQGRPRAQSLCERHDRRLRPQNSALSRIKIVEKPLPHGPSPSVRSERTRAPAPVAVTPPPPPAALGESERRRPELRADAVVPTERSRAPNPALPAISSSAPRPPGLLRRPRPADPAPGSPAGASFSAPGYSASHWPVTPDGTRSGIPSSDPGRGLPPQPEAP